jgi:pimeloyl-ACP methyl ester carboxylesterase
MNIGATAVKNPPLLADDLSIKQLIEIERASDEFFTPQRPNLPDFAPALLACAQRQTLSSGLEATIWSAAQSDTSTKSVLLMHGWSGNSAQLSLFVQPLTQAGYRVVAVDAQGHGKSPGERSDCVAFATAIKTADAEVGPFAHVIGHSLGAAAIMLALDSGLVIDSAVLISPPSILLVLQYFACHKRLPASMLEPMTQAGERYVGKTRDQADSLLVAPRIETPLLLIHDEKDKRCPVAVSESIAAGRANRRLIKTSGLGHHHIIESEDVVRQAISFICPTP